MSPELEEFQDKLEAKFGLTFDSSRREQVEEALLRRRSELGLSAYKYLKRLDEDAAEWEWVAEILTVPESYFFRHPDHLRAFMEIAIPERMAAHPENRTLHILCIGCAHGEEAYTLSMLLLDRADLSDGWKISIRGCDINPKALQRARQGIYTNWALRATPPEYQSRYFSSAGKSHRVNDEIRSRVSFENCNALELSTPDLAGSVDIVFFRNVLIYFSPEAIRSAISGVAHLLAPSGYLFLGPAETLRGVSDDFQLCHTHETFYYRRKDQVGNLVPLSPFARNRLADTSSAIHRRSPEDATLSPDLLLDRMGTEWMDAIERSTVRIRGLHAIPTPAIYSRSSTAPVAVTVAEHSQRILFMLGAERNREALSLIEGLAAELQGNADIQVLRAIAYLNCRELNQAEQVCRELLSSDGLNASANYILAICREHVLDHGAAIDHDRSAIYLDPTFAMPHLHLALIARKRGDAREARREFETADLLLAREDASRMMMFGGGFSREGLRDLCRRELKALGSA